MQRDVKAMGDSASTHLSDLARPIYAMLSSGIPWNMPRVSCIFHIHTPLGESEYEENTSSMFAESHEKVLHNYFIPCLYLLKTPGFPTTSETLQNRF